MRQALEMEREHLICFGTMEDPWSDQDAVNATLVRSKQAGGHMLSGLFVVTTRVWLEASDNDL
jgi:hypothetical protein